MQRDGLNFTSGLISLDSVMSNSSPSSSPQKSRGMLSRLTDWLDSLLKRKADEQAARGCCCSGSGKSGDKKCC